MLYAILSSIGVYAERCPIVNERASLADYHQVAREVMRH